MATPWRSLWKVPSAGSWSTALGRVQHDSQAPNDLRLEEQYGRTVDEIPANVIAAWKDQKDPYIDLLHFATPTIHGSSGIEPD